MAEKPIEGWLPIVPPIESQNTPSAVVAAEQKASGDRVSEFVKGLIANGYAELKSPPHLAGRKFVVTYRTASNPNLSNKITKLQFLHDLGGFNNGFTEVHAIDLLEEIPPSSGNFLPVGHRDFKAVRFSDADEAVARGNFAAKRSLFSESKSRFDKGIMKALSLADKIWTSGADILGKSNEKPPNTTSAIELLKTLERFNISQEASWRNLKLGKLLIGLGVEVLRQQDIDVWDLSAGGSTEMNPILERLGYSQKTKKLNVSQIPKNIYQAFVLPFVN